MSLEKDITENLAQQMGKYVYFSSYDDKWLVRKNCSLEAIVRAVLNEYRRNNR
jgi:hypothetical protein